MNGLPAWVYVRAPEQARFSELAPPKMCASAASERWQPGICSAVRDALSKYASAPPASTLLDDWLVLPAQRPASPEIAESPTVTIHGVPMLGQSAATVPEATPTPVTVDADTSPMTSVSTRVLPDRPSMTTPSDRLPSRLDRPSLIESADNRKGL